MVYVANEPNLSGNLFGASGGDSNITAKATTAMRAMETSATRLVSQLRMAQQLMGQMVRQSQQIATNLARVSGSSMAPGSSAPNLATTGGAGGASQAASQAAQQGQHAQQQVSAMGTRLAGGMGTSGGAIGVAAGIGTTYMLSQTNGLFGADWKAFSNVGASTRSLAPGRFGSAGAATNYLAGGVAGGLTPTDSIAAGQTLNSLGMTPGTREYTTYNARAKILSRMSGASVEDTSRGLAGFQSPQFINFQMARGVFGRNLTTGEMTDPFKIADAQLKTQFETRSGSFSKFLGMGRDQRMQQVQTALKPGGALWTGLQNSGLSESGQESMRNTWLMTAYAGKQISGMSTAEQAKVAEQMGPAYVQSDAKRSQAAAQAQSTALGGTEAGYGAVRGLQTDMISALKDNTVALTALGSALGANSALGGGSGTSAATSILGSFIGNKMANRVAATTSTTGKTAQRWASRSIKALGPVTKGARALGWLEKAAVPLMAVDAVMNRDVTAKYADPNQHIGFGEKIKDSLMHPISSALGSGWGNMKELGDYFTGKRNWWTGKTVGTEVGTRGSSGGGGTTNAKSPDNTGLISEAMKWLGTPYSWGGGSLSGPSRGTGKGSNTVGFDCSGFVRYVFGRYGVNLPRTSQAMANSGKEVPRSDARKGDILIITWSEPNGHVAIYLGNDSMIEAPSSGDVVKVSSVPWGNVSHIRRVIGSAAMGAGGDVNVGKGAGTNVGQGALPFGVGRLWEGAAFWNPASPKPQADPLNPTADTGGGTGLTTTSGGSGGNPKAAFDTLVGMGFTRAAAAGVVGNLQQESGVDPTSAQHGGGPGRGIMQWTKNQRWAQMLKWAKTGKKDPWALGTQVSWMVKEMKDSGVYNKLAKMDDVHAATLYFEQSMEKAGTPNMKARYNYANAAYKGYSEGAWRVSNDQLARVHDGEMIIPSNVAETLRTSIREGFAGQRPGGHGQVVNYVTISANFAPGTPVQQANDLMQTFKALTEQTHTATTARRR